MDEMCLCSKFKNIMKYEKQHPNSLCTPVYVAWFLSISNFHFIAYFLSLSMMDRIFVLVSKITNDANVVFLLFVESMEFLSSIGWNGVQRMF